MTSIAQHSYPQVVWRDRVKKLWNPIHRKALKNRPEERVRLRIIEYLVRSGWSKHRISTEEAIGELGDTSMRTDIICYSQQFDPRLLVECKAEHVPISAQTAEQVARYNQKVEAPFILLSNGVKDYWYAIEDGEQVQRQEERPHFLEAGGDQPELSFGYWQQRGFAGDRARPELRKWFEASLPDLWFPDQRSNIRHIQFGEGPTDVDLSHYYRIVSISEDRRLALTTLNTAFGGNRLIIILNKQDENKAVLEINLDLVFDEKKGNSSVYARDGIRTFDLNKYWSLSDIVAARELAEQADTLFTEYVE